MTPLGVAAKASPTAMAISKTAVLGWDVAQQNERVQSARLQAVLQWLLINIGVQILPYVTRLEAAIVPLLIYFAPSLANLNAAQGSLTTQSVVVSLIYAPMK